MHLKQAGLRTYCVGGELVENSLAVSGRLAKSMLEEFEIDVLLFSAHGVNGAGFIVDPSEKETNLRRYLLKRAACSVFLCDSGKFGRNSIFNIAPLRNVDYLVTNAGPHVLDVEVRRRIITVGSHQNDFFSYGGIVLGDGGVGDHIVHLAQRCKVMHGILSELALIA